jgi:CRP-like cAMP-binding protein
MNQKLQILSNIKKEFNLDQSIYDKVRKVIKYDLSRNQKDKMNFLQELPNKLRIELSQIMHDKVIQNLYFFKDQPSDFFAYVAPLLKPVKFSQDDYLYKVQDMIDEMYFISKGTVIFCLDKKYGEKEIKEIKKNNNFGEIEMCLNEKLSYNIKIKSRNCELFLLKKSNFLKLSVNFKEFIENFLQKSLMKYLKFNEEKNKMIKEFEDLMNSNENNLINNENKDKNLISNDEDSLSNEIEEKSKTNSNESNGENNSNNSDKEKNKLIENDDKETDKKQSKESNFIKRQKTNLGPTLEKKISYNPNIIQNDLNIDVDNLINEDDKENDEKFIEKCNKIIEYINKSNFNFSSLEEDPRDLLKSLKSETDITTKNIIIDKLENIFKKVFEKDSNLKNNL